MNFKPLPRLPYVGGRERTPDDVKLEFRWRAMNMAYWRVLEPNTPVGPRAMTAEEADWRTVHGELAYHEVVTSGENKGIQRAKEEIKRVRGLSTPVDLMLVHRDMERVRRTIESVELWLNFAKTCVAVIERDAAEGQSSSYLKVLDDTIEDAGSRLSKLLEYLRRPAEET